MAGNSQRRNARKPGSKKGPSVGTGGHSRNRGPESEVTPMPSTPAEGPRE